MFSSIKVQIGLFVTVVMLFIFSCYLFNENYNISKERDKAVRNENAYRKDLTSYRDANNRLVSEVGLVEDKYSNLSRSSEKEYSRLRKIISDQNIKIKNIKGSVTIETKIDTEYVKKIKLQVPDTCITLGDSLLLNRVCMDSTKISVKTEINNTLDLLMTTNRETIDPPYKYWVFRIFQKRQDVYSLKIINSNKSIKVKNAEWKIFSKDTSRAYLQ